MHPESNTHPARIDERVTFASGMTLRFGGLFLTLVMMVCSVKAQNVSAPTLVSSFKVGSNITLEFSEPLEVDAVAGSTILGTSEDFMHVT